ncbi:MAG: UvrD-helicase domain-containing protein [Bacteroidales bacterium]|nr:UvrD-helicase domain-containing protein [Bacteroidales bacterium]
MSKIFNELNDAQAEAVKNFSGPSLVIAGAGAGKTRVLTYRIAHLLEKGVDPSSILALTFTNKAAREMKERIDLLLGEDITRYLWMGTFHSMFARILRKESEKLGYPSSFTIYDTDDSRSLLRSIIRELQLDDKIYKPGEVLGRISSAKNNLITHQIYYNTAKYRERDKITRRPMMADIFKLYASRCKKAGAMDFDDLLLYTNILFRDFSDILRKYQEKFHFILVDEYQDTNYSQYLIVNRLGELHKNVCVVGDDAQSIYSFRGAKIENILNFKNDYPDYKLFKLEQNYRSTQNIVNAANSIIHKNQGQIHKTVYSKKEEGERIKVIKALTDIEEGFIVSNSIFDTALTDRVSYNDFAILYRTNAQSRIFEEAMRKRNIPYKVYGSISFYQRKEIKDMIAYLRILVNPNDDEAVKRIINYPARGIGKTTVGKLEEFANKKEISMFHVLENTENLTMLFHRGTLSKLLSFAGFVKANQQKAQTNDAYEVALHLATSTGILKELYNGNTPEERSKYENLEELLNGIRDFVDGSKEEGLSANLDRYLEDIALLTDFDNEKNEDRNRVSIMTMHSAKGLEFNYVYIAGVEEKLFPSPMSLDTLRNLEEERRLFYVAVTRAKKRVIISYARSRYKWGVPNDCQPSRFLKDIDEHYVEWPEKEKKIPDFAEDYPWIRKARSSQVDNTFSTPGKKLTRLDRNIVAKNSVCPKTNAGFEPSDPVKIQPGMLVEHQRFGRGKVVYIEGNMPNKKATVFFQQMKQEKQLLLKFAKLRIVE